MKTKYTSIFLIINHSIFFYINLCILFYLFYFWLRWVFIAACGLSLVVASRGYSSLQCAGFSLWWLLLLGARALGAQASVVAHRLQQLRLAGSRAQAQQLWCAGSRAQAQQLWLMGSRVQAQQLWHTGSRAQAQQLWHTGLVVPWHLGSSQTRALTRVSCIGKQILNHCSTITLSHLPQNSQIIENHL